MCKCKDFQTTMFDPWRYTYFIRYLYRKGVDDRQQANPSYRENVAVAWRLSSSGNNIKAGINPQFFSSRASLRNFRIVDEYVYVSSAVTFWNYSELLRTRRLSRYCLVLQVLVPRYVHFNNCKLFKRVISIAKVSLNSQMAVRGE
jgi:hypothetical protein